jgi:hypothetical protein
LTEADARASLRRRLTFKDVNEAAYALRCDLPAGATETLLIVDQFDELLTETPEPARAPFIDFLLKLAAVRSPGGFHVVLTVRGSTISISADLMARSTAHCRATSACCASNAFCDSI